MDPEDDVRLYDWAPGDVPVILITFVEHLQSGEIVRMKFIYPVWFPPAVIMVPMIFTE